MRVLKNILFEILAFISLFLSLEIMKTKFNSIEWILGIGLLYFGNYILIEVFQKNFKIETKNNLLPIFLKILVPFYTLKILEKDLYKRNMYYLMGMICSVLIILLLEYKYKKENYTKEILTFDNLERVCICLFPFYFLKTGSIKIIYILIFLVFRRIYLERKFEIKKDIKIIYGLLSFFILILLITSVINPIGFKGKAALEHIFTWIFYIFVFFQFIYRKIDYKNILLVTLSSLTIFYAPLFINWIKFGYRINGIRIGTFIDITQTGVILGLLNILLLFYICYKKEIELSPYLLINLIFLLLTGSKGPFILTVFISMIIISSFIKIKKGVYIISIVGMILFIYNSNLPAIKRIKNDRGSTAARKLIYKEGFEQFLKRPILGNGQGTYLEIANKKHKLELEKVVKIQNPTAEQRGIYEAYGLLWYTHSNPLELLRGSGIFAFIFYYGFIGYILSRFFNFYKKSKDKIYLLGLLSLLYFEIYGIIDNVIIYERLQLISVYIVFLIYSYSKKRRRNSNE